MPFKIIRNDITKMNTEAIVNTAGSRPAVGPGCDHAVYEAAGYEELLSYRQQNIGSVEEGEAFITPGFRLPAKYIIHAVSPLYIDGNHGEEEKLRSCYQKSLALAAENGIRSVAFPLISTGGFGYPKEEGMRIAIDEIHAFLLTSDIQIVLVVFDEKATRMGKSLYPDLEAYIDRNYVQEKRAEEYASGVKDSLNVRRGRGWPAAGGTAAMPSMSEPEAPQPSSSAERKAQKPGFLQSVFRKTGKKAGQKAAQELSEPENFSFGKTEEAFKEAGAADISDEGLAIEELERKLGERMAHLSDTFSQYLFYLIREKGLENTDVYKRAIVDKKVFSKIKSNPAYHPQKLTALCLCIGAMLTLDESKDLLARAGYALSPCDKTDIIFSYFIENGIYDMIELDIQLEEHGLPCIIS